MANTTKKIKIRYTSYKMYQVASTGWVFVYGTTSRTKRNSYEVAQVIDGEIAEVDEREAVNGVTNRELAEAWIAN